MQMFGIGVLELLVILILAMLVIGPDRLPGFAADLARWIRRTRAYANHLMRDFQEVIGDLEKEAGASREDWREIASVVGLHTGQVGRELQRVVGELTQAGDLSDVKLEEPAAANGRAPVTANGATANGSVPTENSAGEQSPPQPEKAEPEVEKPWYVPERRSRLRGE